LSRLRVDTKNSVLYFSDSAIPCAIGRSGACPAAEKTEGDGCTPLGQWPVLAALFHPGRMAPPSGMILPWRWIGEQDGWSDDPADAAYNRPVRLPHPHSAERLKRSDPLYDVIIVLGHNMNPPRPGMGSAIFFHIWNDARATEGCVAISRSDMDMLLPQLKPGEFMEIF